MKIISNWKDYYDFSFGFNSDDSRVLKRERKVYKFANRVDFLNKVPQDLRQILRNAPQDYHNQTHSFSGSFYDKTKPSYLLLFCGKVYPLFPDYLVIESSGRFREDNPDYHPYLYVASKYSDKISEFYTNSNSLGNKDERLLKLADMYFGVTKIDRLSYPYSMYTKSSVELIEKNYSGLNLAEKFLIEHKVAYGILCRDYFVAYPELNNLGFFKVLDPFTTYQEVEMFLSNQLVEPDIAPQRVGSDEILAAQKGFDKQSFRTQAPGHKKENRRLNKLKKRNIANNNTNKNI